MRNRKYSQSSQSLSLRTSSGETLQVSGRRREKRRRKTKKKKKNASETNSFFFSFRTGFLEFKKKNIFFFFSFFVASADDSRIKKALKNALEEFNSDDSALETFASELLDELRKENWLLLTDPPSDKVSNEYTHTKASFH